MKTKKIALFFSFMMVLALLTPLMAGDQTKCPVMGGEINKELYVDQDGKRIYVCCENCIPELKKNFEKYETVLEENGESAQIIKQDNDDCKTDCNKAIKKTSSQKSNCNSSAKATKKGSCCK